MTRLGLSLCIGSVSALLLLSPSARAVYECGGVQDTCQCGRDNFCICCSNATYGDKHGNCVWYAWHKACCVWGVALQWCTNAEDWDAGATSNGYPLLGQPCADTVFQCEAYTSECGSGGYGHVGWVETAYPNGSIDVSEQGCYSWYGVRDRHIEAQNASPPMHYIYKPGTSCDECECTPGESDSKSCPLCGVQNRICGGDCMWGQWSECQNQGECEPQQQQERDCPICGHQTRTCGDSCQFDSWSECEGQGECEPGSTQDCGECGGAQTCTDSCAWGQCEQDCSDGSSQADAQVDGGQGAKDSGLDAEAGDEEAGLDDGQGDEGSGLDDGQEQKDSIVGDDQEAQDLVLDGGCNCGSAGKGGLFLLVLLLGLLGYGHFIRQRS